MRKLFTLIFAIAIIALPVLCNAAEYTDEEKAIIARAKEICDLSDKYEDFEVSYEYLYQKKLYTLELKNEYDDIYIRIYEPGLVIEFYHSLSSSYDSINDYYKNIKDKVYSDIDAKAVAEEFLKRNMGEDYKNFVYDYCDYNGARYKFNYKFYKNNVITTADVQIWINKYTNKISMFRLPAAYFEPEYFEFENKGETERAKNIMPKLLKLGYMTKYNTQEEKNEARMLYRFDSYNLSSDMFKPIKEYYSDERNTTDIMPYYTLDDEDWEEFTGEKPDFNVKKALKIIKNTFGKRLDIAEEEFSIDYVMEEKTRNCYYNLYVGDPTYNSFALIDLQGRIVYFCGNGAPLYNSSNLSGEEISNKKAAKIAKKVIKRANTSKYKLTPIMQENYYLEEYEEPYKKYYCYVIRNGYISFDEKISVTVKDRNSYRLSATYIDDEVFKNQKPDKDSLISEEEALKIAFENVDFRPYYDAHEIYFSEKSRAALFGFKEHFSIDPFTGEVLTYMGNEIDKKTGFEMYDDIDNQWYADTALNLLYLNHRFEGSRFEGDKSLTFKDFEILFNEKNTSLKRKCSTDLYDKYSKNADKPLTWYDMAIILADISSNFSYEEYTGGKPYADVDENLGAVALMKENDIVNPDLTEYRGNDIITRAEGADMLYKFYHTEIGYIH